MADETDFLDDVYQTMGYDLYHEPERKDEIFEYFGNVVSLSTNDVYSLRTAYEVLSQVARNNPNMAEEVFAIIQTAVKNKKNQSLSLEAAYRAMADIVKIRPELGKDILPTFQKTLSLKRNDMNSLYFASRVLENVVMRNSALADNVFDTLQNTLKDPKHSDVSIQAAYQTMGYCVKVKPRLEKKFLLTFKQNLDRYQKRRLTASVYKAVENVSKIKPKLAQKMGKELDRAQLNKASDVAMTTKMPKLVGKKEYKR